eukprot:scaffold170924_cov20-Tisochrysis_lutea.AAC.3
MEAALEDDVPQGRVPAMSSTKQGACTYSCAASRVPAEDVTGQQASRDGFETVLEEGEEGEASRSPSPRHAGRHEEREAGKSSDAAGSQSAQVPEG